MSIQTLDSRLAVRVNQDSLDKFIERSESFGRTHAAMLREIINEFNNGNLRIVTTSTKPGELYVNRKEH